MTKICMLAAQDHTTHPIIRRQVDVLRKAGHTLAVLDPAERQHAVPYTWRRVPRVSLQAFGKLVWFFLRRIPSASLGEAWWTFIYFMELLLTNVRYALRATREQADYYHAHELDTLPAALIAGRLRRRPVIYDAHELQSEQGHPGQLIKKLFRAMERRLIPMADQFIVPNQSRARVYVERYGLRHAPTIILNCPPSVPATRANVLRDALGLPASTRIVLYHGTLMAGRALEELLLAARQFEREIVLVVMGQQNAYFRERLQPLCADPQLSERVRFMPFVSPDVVMQYVSSADLGVVIYKNVNLNNFLCAPTKLYEYFMAQLPVVACDFPEMRSVLAEYPVGETFNPDDPASIARAVNAFFAYDAPRRAAVDCALAQARQRFTWEQESQKLLSLFDAAAPQHARASRNDRALVQP